jgi:hypothetical protein
MENDSLEALTAQSELEQIPLSVVESQERANIDMLVTTAKRFPRNVELAVKRMVKMATLDIDTALMMNYALKRKDKIIEGPSVRLAEIALSCWGNTRAGTRTLGHDGKVVTAQAFCHDLEANNFVAWEVQRRITNKQGQTYGDDMIVVTANAAAAIAFRNAALKVIPGAYVRAVADAAKQVAYGNAEPLAKRWERVTHRFSKLGITDAQLFAYVNVTGMDGLLHDHFETLFGLYTAIKEGSTTIEEAFPKTVEVKKPDFGDKVPTVTIDATKEFVKSAQDSSPVIRRRLEEKKTPEGAFLQVLINNRLIEKGTTSLEEVPEKVLATALEDWEQVETELADIVGVGK